MVKKLKDEYEIQGKVKITVWEMRNGEKVIVNEQEVKNTIVYGAGFLLLAMIEEQNNTTTGIYHTVCYTSGLKYVVGSDVSIPSTRSMRGLQALFTPTIQIQSGSGSGDDVYSGKVVGQGEAGSQEQIFMTFTKTFPIGTFNGTQTIGEVGMFIQTGSVTGIGRGKAGVSGLTGDGNDNYRWLLFCRFCVADGDFSPITPTVGQAVTISYQLGF